MPTRSSSSAAAPTGPIASSTPWASPVRAGSGQAVEPGDGLVESVIRDGAPGRPRAGARRGVASASACRSIWMAIPSAVLAATRSRADRPFSELELRMADLLVTQIGVALHNAELHARVSEAAVRDPLTGLLNRRFFDEAVETAFAAAVRNGRELSLIVFDLDHFSEVNNDPRPRGRRRRAAARRPGDGLRRSANGDILARYGGEEFVVIAPGASRDQAIQVAERVRAAATAETSRPIDGLDDPDHDLRRRRVTPRRRSRRPGALPGGRLRPPRREARRPRPRGRASRSGLRASVDDGVALLAHELRDVVHREGGLAGRAAALPAAERLDRPATRRSWRRPGGSRTGRRPGSRSGTCRPRPGPRCRRRPSAPARGRSRGSIASSSESTAWTAVNGANSSSRNSRCDAGRPPTTVGST